MTSPVFSPPALSRRAFLGSGALLAAFVLLEAVQLGCEGLPERGQRRDGVAAVEDAVCLGERSDEHLVPAELVSGPWDANTAVGHVLVWCRVKAWCVQLQRFYDLACFSRSEGFQQRDV